MAFLTSNGLCIKGIVSVFPKYKMRNIELKNISLENRKALIKYTGIETRYKIKEEKTEVKEFFSKGIDTLLAELNWEKPSVDFILVITQTTENTIPAVACELQGDLGFESNTMAYDINLGCSGFVYGLNTAAQTLSSMNKRNARAIICCGDLSSQLIEESDMSVQPIFSDAVAVTGIEINEKAGNSYFNLETFGAGQKAIFTEKSGSKSFMRLNGIDVFNFSVKYVPNNIEALYIKFEKSILETDYFVLHQANSIINKSILRSLNVTETKAPNSLKDFGNTASASIPITLSLEKNLKGKKILMSGFGVGFSVASCLITIENELKTKSIFIDA